MAQHQQWRSAPAMALTPGATYQATLATTKGDIVIDLLVDDAPNTVNNFVFLARAGFYDGVIFHRVIKGFMVQTGDPTGTGTGGPGYRFDDEPVQRRYRAGTVAMANAGRNTNGSQFFIMHQSQGLPPNYTIFGEVTGGMDVVDAIASVPVRASRSGEASSPVDRVAIESVTIEETPAAGGQ
jgi:cyclophilin family peptidyl-prolyl cis-trans isomerase